MMTRRFQTLSSAVLMGCALALSPADAAPKTQKKAAAKTAAPAAKQIVYRWVANAEGNYGAHFRVNYTFGTHEGKSLQGEGSAFFASEAMSSLKKAVLKVPLAALRVGNAEMECHLREAVGLDYSHSAYPKDHVCQNDQLPVTGPDAVAYPEIVLTVDQIEFRNSSYATLTGHWKLHGEERPTQFSAEFTRQGQRILVQAQPTLSLKEFGVEVKNFLFITTSDTVQLDLNIELERQP